MSNVGNAEQFVTDNYPGPITTNAPKDDRAEHIRSLWSRDYGKPGENFLINEALATLRTLLALPTFGMTAQELQAWAVGAQTLMKLIDTHLSNNGKFPRDWVTKENWRRK